ncbi:hypothetical protein PF007_g1853 [Phytophthora fragariae]|nr:hypothetical protein PF009_g1748 [Phytophthora fragariae]KAE9137300.1 hypothetical protein PF007_g1853 [Phytophthora fragariae]
MKLSLWTGKFRSTELFQFVAGWSVDLAQWVQEISDLTSQKDAYEGFRQEGGQVLREKGRIVRSGRLPAHQHCQGREPALFSLFFLSVLLLEAASFAPFALDKSCTNFARICCATCCH